MSLFYISTALQRTTKLTGQPTLHMFLDKYDYVILDIIQTYKKNNKNELIKLSQLETAFWSRIEHDDASSTRSAQLGERVANLYLDGYIMNKNNSGYRLTKKGKEELSFQEVTV